MVSKKIDANINFKTGNKYKARIISINKVKEALKDKYDAVVSVGYESFTKALLVSMRLRAAIQSVPLLV